MYNARYLSNLLDIDNIFGIFRVWINYLSASGHLSWQKPVNVSQHIKIVSYQQKINTWRGCSSCIICLSETRSHWLGAANPVSDSLIPIHKSQLHQKGENFDTKTKRGKRPPHTTQVIDFLGKVLDFLLDFLDAGRIRSQTLQKTQTLSSKTVEFLIDLKLGLGSST